METLQRATVDLLKSAITGQAVALPEGFDLEAAYPQLQAHQMDTLLYEGAVRCGISRNLPIMKLLMQRYCGILLKSEGQMGELRRVTAAFEENGIDYMLLKGSKMKALYPRQELRNMSDADVLIRMEQYDRICPIMESLGFEKKNETDHELIWRTKNLFLELHSRLIPSYNKDFYAYFGDGWDLAVPEAGHSFTMAPEDMFIYLFTHYAKHFRDGGIGCRHVVDLWVYLRANPGLDMARIRRELEKLHLLTFFDYTRRILDVWFEGGETDPRVDVMTAFIFASGSYGRMEKRLLSVAVRDSENTTAAEGKRSYVWKMAFPPARILKHKYTVLEKAPWLLPAVWVYRPFYKVLCERSDVQRHRKNVESLTTEGMNEHKKLLNYMGLDYNF